MGMSLVVVRVMMVSCLPRLLPPSRQAELETVIVVFLVASRASTGGRVRGGGGGGGGGGSSTKSLLLQQEVSDGEVAPTRRLS